MLKAITSAIKEGIQNLALYSQAIGGIDASRANAPCRSFPLWRCRLRISVGAAPEGRCDCRHPLFKRGKLVMVAAMRSISFAAIPCASAWTKAKVSAVDFADGLGKATGAAKKLKNAVLGIDELNVLNQDAGGVGGAAASNYADMFEEMAVSALAFEIKDIFFKWKDLT